MQGYIYCIQENGKVIYVGCTQNISKRISDHLLESIHLREKSQPIHRYINQKGIENFEFKILAYHEFNDNNDMFDKEAYFIEKFGTCKFGFNIATGGNRGKTFEKNPNARKIKCLNTGEEFDTIQRACWKYGLGITEMSSHLSGKRYKNGIGKRKLGVAYKFEYVK